MNADHQPAMPALSRRAIALRARAWRAARLLLAMLWVTASGAAELKVSDGVVVKFGADAQLVVLDKFSAGSGVVLTSQRDDAAGGQVNAEPQSPAAGDWGGLRFEKSAGAFGTMTLSDFTLRYAGGASTDGFNAGLLLRGISPSFQYLRLNDNLVGLRLESGAAPTISGSSFLRNGTGLDADGGSTATITSTQFASNSTQAVLNRTPATVIQASGNWWGDASGPRDPIGNPQGQGDSVSAGVNYANYLAQAPLLNPKLNLSAPAAYYPQPQVSLTLACINATEYRVAEDGAFSGVSFLPLPGERLTFDYNVSSGEGRKNLSAQFRNDSGTVVTANLAEPLYYDTAPPALTITNPAPGSTVDQSITVVASVSDAAGIARVEFYLDNQLKLTRTASPYNYDWNVDNSADGPHGLRVVAYDVAGRSTAQTVDVVLSRAPAPPDTEGPQLSNVSFDGSPLADGATLSRNGSVTVSATDRSGVSRVELLLDGLFVASASGSGTYSAVLDLSGAANGAHVLSVRSVDSLNNFSTQTFNIVVAHAPPAAPLITQPSGPFTTRDAQLSVAGTATSGAVVQVTINGEPAGAPLSIGGDGRFSTTIVLASGSNLIQAFASDQYGTGTGSNTVVVTLDTSVPATPGSLSATAQEAGKVRLVWSRPTDPNVIGFDVYRSNGSFSSVSEASKINLNHLTATSFDDMPPQDGTWFYRAVSVNGADTPSAPTNQAQVVSDGTAPRALSVVYSPQGKVDASTGRIGQGRVDLVLTASETLQSAPYLAIVPQGGAPVSVTLVAMGGAAYSGSFLIDANTPSGTANALFSARDVVGNRGTDIETGATLKIDTDGPVLSNIVLNPAAPIKNDTAQTVQATFTFSKQPKSTPEVSYLLSGPVRSPVVLSGLTPVDPMIYEGSFTLPSDAGAGAPESLSFSFQAQDDLDNLSNKVAAFNSFQVYQGELPPLEVPFGFTAKAQPGGKVKLNWQAVDEAGAYQLYRQGPGETELSPLTRTAGVDHVDQTPQDGAYKYAVASVRMSNGEEAVSGQSAAIDVVASATAPGAPQNLALRLTGQGIVAEWQPPLASTVSSYNLYRAGGTSIGSVDGMAPRMTGVLQPYALDANPSATESSYAVTALDEAGNESAISNSAYLNASLLPVKNLRIEQIDSALPSITWDAPNGSVAGYLVYVGPDASRIKLTPAPTPARAFTDTGYSSGERHYTVASVDANGVEMPRSLLLPSVVTQIASGLPIKRGVMNKLQVQVANTSASSLSGLRVVVRLPIDRDATQFKDHKSEAFTLGPNQTLLMPVIVGGYADLPGAPQIQVGVEVAANEGELVKIARSQTVDVTDGALVVGMATDEFTRGGTGKLKLTIENTSEVDIELLTATGNGASESSELRFKILDADGNVLATQAYKQVFGASVITLTNGLTVARIPAGENYVSDVFNLNVPGSSPNSIRVRLEVDKLRYHSGQEDEVIIAGRGSERTVSLSDTAYIGEVSDVAPISSFGDQDIIITGRALDRVTLAPLPNTRLKLILNQQGFERNFNVLTDASGSFTHTFEPTITDSGLYKVSAVHPDITDRPEQKAFTINRVTVGPAPYKLDVPRNYPFSIPFTAKAGPGTAATNLRFMVDPVAQPTGQVPSGIGLRLPAPVTLAERQTLNVPVEFTANNDTTDTGSVILSVVSDESPITPIGLVRVDYMLSEAKPFLTSTPSYVETGLTQGGSQMESVTVQNKGLQDALNLQFALVKPDGSPVPDWASLASQADGTLEVGGSRVVDLAFNPPSSTAEGVYEFRLTVQGENVPLQTLNVYASVTQSGEGNVLFKAADIYTATVDQNGQLIPGLAGARITMQNEDVVTVTQELVTDDLGEALFQNLPAGRYKFRATASNHQEVGGRLQIKPGITATQPVFLDYNLITVEWSVREITIQDRYEITLNATYETDVPAAVVVMQPSSINLPKMNAGDVYYGELALTNFGLIRAENVQQQLPQSDAYFRYEFLVDVPPALEAKQRITIPYRVIALQSLDTAATSETASGGGCWNYSNTMRVSCDYQCANGNRTACGAMTSWFSLSNSTCTGGSGGGGGGGGGGFGGGGFGGAGTSTPLRLKGKKCVLIPRAESLVCE